MDPSATLETIRELCFELFPGEDPCEHHAAADLSAGDREDLLEELVAAIVTLDDWLTGGGFRPREWDDPR